MQTMTALVRVAGDLNMTVCIHEVTPAEAYLLMHIHAADTKDVFEDAVMTAEVKRSRIEERDRLLAKYPGHEGLIQHLFPGRNAGDVPEAFHELQDTPLEVSSVAAMSKAEKAKAKARMKADAPEEPELTDDEIQQVMLTGKKG